MTLSRVFVLETIIRGRPPSCYLRAVANRTMIHRVLPETSGTAQPYHSGLSAEDAGCGVVADQTRNQTSNGFSVNNTTSDWNALMEHARGLLHFEVRRRIR